MNGAVERSFCEVLSSVGRSDFLGAYRPSRHGGVNEKFSQRERVLDFIIGNHSDGRKVKLLSFPGSGWVFEEMLLAERPGSQVVGLEHSFSVYAKSRLAMPFGRDSVQDRVMHYGSGTITYSRCGHALLAGRKRTNRSHRLLLMDSATFTSVLATDYKATIEQKREFNSRFCGRTAVWLDFTGCIGKPVLDTLANLPLTLELVRVPVCLTILNGRDKLRGADSRIASLIKAQPAFVPHMSWTYVGGGGSSMLTVCGFISAPEPANGRGA